jgi:hypothetical protein
MSAVLRMWNTVTVIVLVLIAPEAAWGQATSGRILGRVTDPSGSVVAGVAVSVTSDRTGLTRTATTAGDGEYLVTNLPPVGRSGAPRRLHLRSG